MNHPRVFEEAISASELAMRSILEPMKLAMLMDNPNEYKRLLQDYNAFANKNMEICKKYAVEKIAMIHEYRDNNSIETPSTTLPVQETNEETNTGNLPIKKTKKGKPCPCCEKIGTFKKVGSERGSPKYCFEHKPDNTYLSPKKLKETNEIMNRT
jgi:hypothetical protein